MSAKKYLTDGERDDLRTKYAEDKLNNPPANISDKTLIENYGDEGQRGRLAIENFDVAVLTDPNFKTHPKTGGEPNAENGTGAQNGNDINVATKDEGVNSGAGNIEEMPKSGDVTDINVGDIPKSESDAETEKAAQIEIYKELHGGNVPDSSWDIETIKGANVTKQTENLPLQNSDPQAAEFAKLFNDYLRLTGNRPFGGWNLEQLKTELEKEIETRAEKIKSENEAKKNANLPQPANDEEIRLKHKDSGREITVTKQAYENFIAKNQPEWVKVAPVPKELQ